MSNEERLKSEKESLLALADQFEHISIEVQDNYDRSYKISFQVKSIADFDSGKNEFETVQEHEIELNLPVTFPSVEPELRWLTPIFHPNVSLSGYLDLQDIGFRWSSEMSLIVICERLWDIARFAWVDVDSANNYSAKRKWNEGAFKAPTDDRVMKSKSTTPMSNIVSYQKLGSVTEVEIVQPEIIEIGDESVHESKSEPKAEPKSPSQPHPDQPTSPKITKPEVFVIDDQSAPSSTNDDDDIFVIE